MRYIDIHCHPSLKPYGRSFDSPSPGRHALSPRERHHLYHYAPAGPWQRVLNRTVMGLTKFSQSDFTAVAKGRFSTIIASLTPIEKGVIAPGQQPRTWVDLLSRLAIGIGPRRIRHLQSEQYEYFSDLEQEYAFCRQMDGLSVRLPDGSTSRYRLSHSIHDPVEENSLRVFLSIEGGHAFNAGMPGKLTVPEEVLSNVGRMKQWRHVPLMVGLAHHLYNDLCGHAKSLDGLVFATTLQSQGMNTGFTPLGERVVHALLDEGPRCLIDIKHMSRLSRQHYMRMLAADYQGQRIPLLATHGAVNGRLSLSEPHKTRDARQAALFFPEDINFYDEEVVAIGRSGGLFGIQLDERRIGSRKAVAASNLLFERREQRLLAKAKLVWEQLRYCAELLDRHELPAWEVQTLGSDYDGIINPVNHLWTAEHIQNMEPSLLQHAQHYMETEGRRLQPQNQLEPAAIIDAFLFGNAQRFLREHAARPSRAVAAGL